MQQLIPQTVLDPKPQIAALEALCARTGQWFAAAAALDYELQRRIADIEETVRNVRRLQATEAVLVPNPTRVTHLSRHLEMPPNRRRISHMLGDWVRCATGA